MGDVGFAGDVGVGVCWHAQLLQELRVGLVISAERGEFVEAYPVHFDAPLSACGALERDDAERGAERPSVSALPVVRDPLSLADVGTVEQGSDSRAVHDEPEVLCESSALRTPP